MPQVSKLFRDAVIAKLSHATTGFNARLAAVASTYGITAFEIDFTTGSNFFQGALTPDVLARSSRVQAPFMCLYATGWHNENQEKSRVFSGPVDLTLDVELAWQQDNPDETNFESMADAVEDVILATLNESTHSGWGSVVYAKQIECVRSPVSLDASSFSQSLSFNMTAVVNA